MLKRLVRAMSKPSPELAKNLKVEPLDQGKWINLKTITYQDPAGTVRQWDCAVRSTRPKLGETGIDGVGILAILKQANVEDRIVLQKQFRPPVDGVCIEIPAGLVDDAESIETSALRELREETGYIGTVVNKSQVLFNDPGFTNTNLILCTVEVDMSDPRNQNPVPELEENEFIETFTVPIKDLFEEMEKLAEQGYKLDARLQNIAQGIKIAQMYKL